ncbi:MAG: ubiquinol-cytochrome c reductase iron-sulfur subunit [Candidatus Acidiferrales bacterium]
MPEKAESKTAEKHGAPAAPLAATNPNSSDTRKKDVDRTRRRFIWTFLWGYLGVNFLMFLRYFFPRALFEPPAQVNIGVPASFQMGVNQQFLQSDRIWVRKDPGRIFVIRAICTHLGCTPDWMPMQNIFHCPCHGSEYDIDGINFAGPAPRPMDRCAVQLQPDGTILVDTSTLFLDEPYAGIDQFNDPGAYLNV